MKIIASSNAERFKLSLSPGQLVRYWHPRHGGWHHAVLLRLGPKWATLRDCSPDSHRRPWRMRAADIERPVF
jgi:hypothetical protein